MNNSLTRRELLAAGAALGAFPGSLLAMDDAMTTKPIPNSGEQLPVIGLGTYNVFDVNSTPDEIAAKKAILELLIEHGGSVVDTSPMYNRSEKVIGDAIQAGAARKNLFLATKVWTDGQQSGVTQMQRSADLMNAKTVDLMQVHNLRDTDVHMESIGQLKDSGNVRYSGLTHYTAGGMPALEQQMRQFKPDFVQINYSLGEREAEQRILPLARELNIAVLINRPYQAGRLFGATSGKALPDWATEFANSWGQFFLKFIISHPAVNCAIPATSKPQHMIDNLGAGRGPMPDAATRQRMIQFFSDV